MAWIIVVTGIIIILFRFLASVGKQNRQLKSEGGVRVKYGKLIELLKANSNPKVFQSDLDTYLFGWVSPNADSRFRIIEAFGFVDIKWQFKGALNIEGKIISLSKDWKFPEDTNQEHMAEKIILEMNQAFNNSELGNF